MNKANGWNTNCFYGFFMFLKRRLIVFYGFFTYLKHRRIVFYVSRTKTYCFLWLFHVSQAKTYSQCCDAWEDKSHPPSIGHRGSISDGSTKYKMARINKTYRSHISPTFNNLIFPYFQKWGQIKTFLYRIHNVRSSFFMEV